MATYPNQGEDSRLDLFGILAWLQNTFSFASTKPPRWLIRFTGKFKYWFPEEREYVRFGIAWPHYFVLQVVHRNGEIRSVPVSPPEHPDGLKWFAGKVSIIRGGWLFPVPLVLLYWIAWYFVAPLVLLVFIAAWRYDPNVSETWPGGYVAWASAVKLFGEDLPMERGF